MAAAADYNRALAYAPNDPVLLKVVSSMQRSEARARVVRRVAPLVLGALLLGSGAYFVASALRPTVGPAGPTPSSSSSSRVGAVPVSAPPRIASAPRASASASSSQSASAATRTIAVPTVVSTVKPGVTRQVSFRALSPPFGVQMSIDGAPPVEVDRTKPLAVDEKVHTLVFTCRGDLCMPKTMTVPAGTGDVDLAVELAVPPARLFVEGDPTHSYGITEIPTVNVAGGGEIDIPMAGSRAVHVFDRTDPVAPAQAVTLSAGKRTVVSFKK